MLMLNRLRLVSLVAASWLASALSGCSELPATPLPPAAGAAEQVAPYRPRPGHERPLVAVVGHNAGTELVDFLVPYGVLRRSGVAEVVAVSTDAGPMKMRPGLTLQADATIDQFDQQHAQGADYVVVPAVLEQNVADPRLQRWLQGQASRGAVIVSICDGALVVAEAGLFKGHRATGHWATQAMRESRYPDTRWLRNVRYVDDGTVISSAGVTAALPLSLALVEAIGGREKAIDLAAQLGIDRWDSAHASEGFHLRVQDAWVFARNRWLSTDDTVEWPVAADVDEIALALSVDAWGRTMRTKVEATADTAGPVRSLGGITIVPGAPAAAPALRQPLLAAAPAQALDRSLDDIAGRYGRTTADFVRLQLEYPRPAR
ncbi:DJ-1/PfpI family protein [Ideonella sp.]|uniref:DJ-1/PfpI family protein n=1 Tax=Ideonella sp. TaxID=1929293 RepID=UPI0035B4D42E